MSFRWKVIQEGLMVAAGDAPTLEICKQGANHYAMQYAEDGPIDVRLYEGRKRIPYVVSDKESSGPELSTWAISFRRIPQP